MITPSLTQIDNARMEGFRPQAVGCFIHGKKMFMFYKKKYDLWQFPQGGIENKETIEDALAREMTEELGEGFFSFALKNYKLLGSNSVKFPPEKRGGRNLATDSGQQVEMIGKWYYFIAVQTAAGDLNMAETEFEDYRLLSYDEAIRLAESIYQKGKKRTTLLTIDLLKQNGLIE